MKPMNLFWRLLETKPGSVTAGWLVALAPLWLWLIARALAPEGFWITFALGALGLFFGGALQLVLGGVAIWWTFEVLRVQ